MSLNLVAKRFSVAMLLEIERRLLPVLPQLEVKARLIYIGYQGGGCLERVHSFLTSHKEKFLFPHPVIHHSAESAMEIKPLHRGVLLMTRCIGILNILFPAKNVLTFGYIV